MAFEDLRNASREQIQGITAEHSTLALPKAFLSKEAQSISLASLVEKLEVAASAKSTPQVGSQVQKGSQPV